MNEVQLKAVCNRSHARRRASERYGINLTNESIDEIEGLIRKGGDNCHPLRPDHWNNKRCWYAVKFDGVWLPVVFDSSTDSLISVLPHRALDPYMSKVDPVKGLTQEQVRAPIRMPGLANGSLIEESGLNLSKVEIKTVPEKLSVEECRRFILQTKVRIRSIEDALSKIDKKDRRTHKFLVIEKEKGIDLLKVLHEERDRRRSDFWKLTDPNNPTQVVNIGLRALRTMAARLKWQITEEEQEAMSVVQEYIEHHLSDPRFYPSLKKVE